MISQNMQFANVGLYVRNAVPSIVSFCWMLLARSVRLRVLVASKVYMTWHIIFRYKISYTRPLAVIGVSFSGLSHFFLYTLNVDIFWHIQRIVVVAVVCFVCLFVCLFHTFTLIMINIVTKGIISSFKFLRVILSRNK